MYFLALFRTELIKDLECQVAFNLFDEATVADWKGKDLKQANNIPNIDVLLLAVRKVFISTIFIRDAI